MDDPVDGNECVAGMTRALVCSGARGELRAGSTRCSDPAFEAYASDWCLLALLDCHTKDAPNECFMLDGLQTRQAKGKTSR